MGASISNECQNNLKNCTSNLETSKTDMGQMLEEGTETLNICNDKVVDLTGKLNEKNDNTEPIVSDNDSMDKLKSNLSQLKDGFGLGQDYLPLGAYKDQGIRALNYGPKNYGYTVDTCRVACADHDGNKYRYFSLQNGVLGTNTTFNQPTGWCSCTNDLEEATKYGKAVGTAQCAPRNGAGHAAGVGGAWCNSLYINLKHQE
jgi:regulator of replication initiation timing